MFALYLLVLIVGFAAGMAALATSANYWIRLVQHVLCLIVFVLTITFTIGWVT